MILPRFLPSPHCDDRPPGTVIDLLVVHAISLPPGEFGGGFVDDLFLGRLEAAAHPSFEEICRLRVSAHFLVGRGGGVTQYVPVMKRAWHAGVSSWEGRERCNDFSVGVELEGDAKTPFTGLQYEALTTLVAVLSRRLAGLCPDRIVGHQDVAPGRKWDPGPCFDWSHFRGLLRRGVALPAWEPVWE
ncbi:MAG: 1,6-anhydro-N-acetylmuramyl-L-alanine amidase AmpD [Magnetococcales bacterium]|nr:1,6-anhydro-N-acetylmuramyl-L-alanine amidase AmpD [Magnetococcales bacterium]